MTVVSNDPADLPLVSYVNFLNYCVAVAFAVVLHNWALTFGREVELIWMKRWSFMTVLYISVRYIGILYSVIIILWYLPLSITDADCLDVYFIWTWTPVLVNAMLGVIMMTRIRAMYQQSKKISVFLVTVLAASTIATVVMTVMADIGTSAEEFIILGYHTCLYNTGADQYNLTSESLAPTAIWEILTLVLAVWIIIKHLRELRQSATGSTIGGCLTVLTKSHAFYFVAFATVACFNLGSQSTLVLNSLSMGSAFYSAVFQVFQALQLFVLGPRLILSVREYHAKLVTRSDEGICMTSIYFQAGGDALVTGGDV